MNHYHPGPSRTNSATTSGAPAVPGVQPSKMSSVRRPGLSTETTATNNAPGAGDLFLLALHIILAAPSADNDETKAQLEETAFLPIVADILRHDISRIPFAGCATARDKSQAGTIHAGEKNEQAHPTKQPPSPKRR